MFVRAIVCFPPVKVNLRKIPKWVLYFNFFKGAVLKIKWRRLLPNVTANMVSEEKDALSIFTYNLCAKF